MKVGDQVRIKPSFPRGGMEGVIVKFNTLGKYQYTVNFDGKEDDLNFSESEMEHIGPEDLIDLYYEQKKLECGG